MNLYAMKLLGARTQARGNAQDAIRDGLDMQDGTRTLRLEFPHRITTLAAAAANSERRLQTRREHSRIDRQSI